MEKEKTIEVLKMIAKDAEDDAKNFDGLPFTGKNVGTQFGNHGASIASLAEIIIDILITPMENKKPKLYYTAPSDEIFDEVKQAAIQLWSTIGDEPNYSKEKIDRIKDIKNVQDNLMYMVAMFDIYNQRKLAGAISSEARSAISERMKDCVQPD
mgnify:CR=1 FL=1